MTAAVKATPEGLRVEGEVTYANADELSEQGVVLLQARQSQRGEQSAGAATAMTDAALCIDLGGVTEPGTIVVAVLLSWYRALRPRAITLRLINVSPSLQRILQFTGVMNVLEANVAGVRS